MGMDERNSKKGVFTKLKAYLDRNRLGEILVLNGHISTKQLRNALHQQKQTNKPLGQIFVQNSMISRRDLFLTLSRQTSLRVCAAMLFCAASISTIGGKKARADNIKDIPAGISISMSAHFAAVAAYPALFGSDEKRSSNLSAFTKWTGMFDRFDRSMANAGNRQIMQEWQENIKSFADLPLDKMAERVNAEMNKVRYISDDKNYGQSDYWATPAEFMQRGGDCEDYAIAKYTALRALGVPEDRLRVAIVHDMQKNIPHAVLIVYADSGAMILDNQDKRTRYASEVKHYRPIFSINRDAWWVHTAGSSTMVASAAQ